MRRILSQYDQLRAERRRSALERILHGLSLGRAARHGVILGLAVALIDSLDRMWPGLQPRTPTTPMGVAIAIVISPILGALLFISCVAIGRAILRALLTRAGGDRTAADSIRD